MTGRESRRGFALVVVLGTLSIIALLFASASTRMLARMTESATEQQLARQAQEVAALLDLALSVYGSDPGQHPTDAPLTVPWLDGEATLVLQDVGGLVNLNAGAPELIDRLARGLGIPPEALTRFRRWRRTPYRLQTVRDFTRVAQVDAALAAPLERLATVHSARHGISAEHAPPELIALLTGAADEASADPALLRPEWLTLSSGSVFKVWLHGTPTGSRYLGTIRLGEAGTFGMVVEAD